MGDVMNQKQNPAPDQQGAKSKRVGTPAIILAVLLGPVGLVAGIFSYLRAYKEGKDTRLSLIAIGIGMIWTVIAICNIVIPAQTAVNAEQNSLNVAMQQLKREGMSLDDLQQGAASKDDGDQPEESPTAKPSASSSASPSSDTADTATPPQSQDGDDSAKTLEEQQDTPAIKKQLDIIDRNLGFKTIDLGDNPYIAVSGNDIILTATYKYLQGTGVRAVCEKIAQVQIDCDTATEETCEAAVFKAIKENVLFLTHLPSDARFVVHAYDDNGQLVWDSDAR